MNTVFDLSAETYREWPMGAIPLLFFLYAVWRRFFSMQRRLSRGSLFFGTVSALLFIALPVWDFYRMKAILDSGDGVQTVQGRLTGYYQEIVRTRESNSISKYRTSIWEGFTVNGRKFGFYHNTYPSSASFTNAQEPPVALFDGLPVRIAYTVDPAYNNDLRILRLEVGENGATPNPEFDRFWQGFRNAFVNGDEPGVKKLTRFPFLFAGTPLPPDRFETAWMGLFPPPIRACLQSIRPHAAEDKQLAVCGAYRFVFNRYAEGWRFSAFIADTE